MMMEEKVSILPGAGTTTTADTSTSTSTSSNSNSNRNQNQNQNQNQNRRRRRPVRTTTRRLVPRTADYDNRNHNHNHKYGSNGGINTKGNNNGKTTTTTITAPPIFKILIVVVVVVVVAVVVVIYLSLVLSLLSNNNNNRRFIGGGGRRPMNDLIINEIPIRILSFDYTYENNENNYNYNYNYKNENYNKRNDIGGWNYIRRFFHPPSSLIDSDLVTTTMMEPDFGGLDIIQITINGTKVQNTNTNIKFLQQQQQLPPSREINTNDRQLAELYWNTFHFGNDSDNSDQNDPYLSRDNDYLEAHEDRARKCHPMTWSKQYYPSCNSIHEINLGGNHHHPNQNTQFNHAVAVAVADLDVVFDTFYIAHGHYRDVWVVHQAGLPVVRSPQLPRSPRSLKSVLKITRWKHQYSHSTYWNTLADAMVMERLTKSPRIVDIYGHCGTAVWVEALPHEVEEVIVKGEGMAKQKKLDRQMKHNLISFNNYTILEKLNMAIRMAESIADLHGFVDGVIVHDDVQLCQWLQTIDGTLKLGDFNRAEVMEYNDQKKEYCKYNNGDCYGNYRSPEEYSAVDLDEGIDVYTFGNNIYSLLTGLWVFYDTDDDSVVQKKVINGTRAYIDPRWRTRSYIETKLVDVMEQCWAGVVNDNNNKHNNHKERIDIFQVVKLLRDIEKENELRMKKKKNKINHTTREEELKMTPQVYNNMMGRQEEEEEEEEEEKE